MKITLLILAIATLLLPMAACGVATRPPCDICGEQQPTPGVSGGTTHGMSYFEVFAEHGGSWLQIFVENCRPSTASPVHRLHFTAQYNLDELYEQLQHAESNEPFAVLRLDEDLILILSEIPGLELIQLGLSNQQPIIGYAYTMARGGMDITILPIGE